MKRFFFTAITLAAVAVGCTKSGLLESPKTYEDPISFEPYTGKATMTKATAAGIETIQSEGFSVIGFLEDNDNKITSTSTYLNVDVTDTDKDDSWTYGDNMMYWPDGADLTFVAYGNNANVTNPVETDYTKLTYTVPAAVADQEDLVISPVKRNCNSTDANGDNTENKKVTVQLYHALSRVGFSVRTEGSANSSSDVVITHLSLNGSFVPSATFDLTKIATPTGKTLTLKTDNTNNDANYFPVNPAPIQYSLLTSNYTTADKTNGVADKTNQYIVTYPIDASVGNGQYMMLLPSQVGNITEPTGEDVNGNGTVGDTVPPYIKVVYELTGAQSQTAYIPLQITNNGALENFTFESGKAYEFVFTVSTIKVGFDVTVGTWNPGFTDDNNASTETEAEGYFPLN